VPSCVCVAGEDKEGRGNFKERPRGLNFKGGRSTWFKVGREAFKQGEQAGTKEIGPRCLGEGEGRDL
jgi:hypothetical protein